MIRFGVQRTPGRPVWSYNYYELKVQRAMKPGIPDSEFVYPPAVQRPALWLRIAKAVWSWL